MVLPSNITINIKPKHNPIIAIHLYSGCQASFPKQKLHEIVLELMTYSLREYFNSTAYLLYILQVEIKNFAITFLFMILILVVLHFFWLIVAKLILIDFNIIFNLLLLSFCLLGVFITISLY